MDILLDNEIHQEIFPLDHYKLVNTIQNSNYLLIPIKQKQIFIIIRMKMFTRTRTCNTFCFAHHTVSSKLNFSTFY
jgi:hypothetical protein